MAVQVADGRSVDWNEALRSASDERERRIISHLRLVEEVARVHRSAASDVAAGEESLTATATMGAARAATYAAAIGTWGHLELRKKLGEGAFGEVYRAWDSRLDREVALKLLKPDSGRGAAAESRAIAEGRMLARLRHPNVVTVYGAETHDGRVGFWMEFIQGRSLAQLLAAQGPFGAREAALIGIDLCRALAAVHRAGVIHRDVKAENALREEGGRILLTDFGAGIEMTPGKDERAPTISGTPFYMAPELLLGEAAGQRSDIYSLGVLLYLLVTGSFPIEAASWKELRDKHARRAARLLRDRRPDLPEGFVALVERATAWDPARRFGTAGEMEQALLASIGTASASAPDESAASGRRRGLVLAATGALLGALVVVALLVASLVRREPRSATPGGTPADGAMSRQPAGDPGEAAGSVSHAPASPVPYTVEAAIYRASAESVERTRLEPGARLKLGDTLTLEFRSSAPLYVYIIEEDEAGHSYALFPLPGFDQRNPLSPGVTHVLPGSRDGTDLSWTVDSAGGREHLMVLASPTRLVEFEADMNALARPGQVAVALPETAKTHLRGIGALSKTPAVTGGASAARLFDMAQSLVTRSEVAEGVWLRRIDLENPATK